MTRARNALIDLSATPYYHLIAGCVRRAFLCGEDKYSGKNFDHRREWLVERMQLLSSVFAIEIAAYAIMSNHYHLVVKVNKQTALDWSDDEVIRRWYQLYNGDSLVDRGSKKGQAQISLA
ncbi:transposase, partial [Pseudoalteromonas sp. MMG005]|nr:transposase [Pseudoalteromonas sp. MMG005]